MLTTLTLTLMFLAPALVTTLAMVCTLVCLPMVWARLERPYTPDHEADGWALALDSEMDLDAALEALEASIAPCPVGARVRRVARNHAPWVGMCRPFAYTPRRAHTLRARPQGPSTHRNHPHRDANDGVFGVLAARVPTRKLAYSLDFLRVGGRGPPPPSGG